MPQSDATLQLPQTPPPSQRPLVPQVVFAGALSKEGVPALQTPM